jgi:hypothetical protein
MSEQARASVKVPDTKIPKSVPSMRQPESASSQASPYEQILYLQGSIGNRAVERLFKCGILQAKLKISESNDIYEQEADRVAERIMRMPEPTIQPKPT